MAKKRKTRKGGFGRNPLYAHETGPTFKRRLAKHKRKKGRGGKPLYARHETKGTVQGRLATYKKHAKRKYPDPDARLTYYKTGTKRARTIAIQRTKPHKPHQVKYTRPGRKPAYVNTMTQTQARKKGVSADDAENKLDHQIARRGFPASHRAVYVAGATHKKGHRKKFLVLPTQSKGKKKRRR